MKTSLSKQDKRKTKLFNAWMDYLGERKPDYENQTFDEIYEGRATILDLSPDKLRVQLEDGRKIKYLPITPEICKHTTLNDSMHLLLGRLKRRWWALDLISIATIVNRDRGEMHFTFNPFYVRRHLISEASQEIH